MEFLEVPLYDDDLYKLCVRFFLNLIFLSVVVTFAIYRNEKQREFVFTTVMMNVTVFFICFTLKKLELDLGMALGLFAIFAVLRFRTDSISTKEMTYLFIVIGIAVINSLSNKKTSYAEILIVNSVIVMGAVFMERFCVVNRLRQQTITFGDMALLHPQRRDELLDALRLATGLNVVEVEIKRMDLKKKSAQIMVSYDEAAVAPPAVPPEEERNVDSEAPKAP
ncbi:MAG: hypothetical protein ACJASX_003204 [Limisphaerales bacterium]|jgi:hypothetical protein